MQFYLVACAIFALAVAPARGAASRVLRGCERHLFDVQAKLGSIVSDDFLGSEELSQQPTVQVTGSRAGRFDGRRLIVERTGPSWVSKFKSVRFDPQGDPRWFIDAVGPDAARFFGFEILDDVHMTVPDAAEFRGAVARLNTELTVPIPIAFYATADNANVRVAEYVNTFALLGAIPLAHAGNHLIHDLSFHSGAIFLPPEVLALKRLSAEYLDGFIAYLGEKYPVGPRATAVAAFAFAWRFRETQSIDVGTALINPGIVNFMRDPQANDDFFIRSPLKTMVNEALPLPERLRRFIKDLEGNSQRAQEYYLDFLDFEAAANHLKVLSVRTLREDLAEYQRKFDPTGARTIAPYLAFRGPRPIARLCKSLQLRRLEISSVAARLAAGAEFTAQTSH